ncbi:hypothetical protein [Nitratifractor sp.]
MDRASRTILERFSREAHNLLTHYRYNRSRPLHPRYRKGQIDALRWLCELGRIYLEEERRIPERLRRAIERECHHVEPLPPGPYRQGIEDALDRALELLEG